MPEGYHSRLGQLVDAGDNRDNGDTFFRGELTSQQKVRDKTRDEKDGKDLQKKT